MEPTESTKNIHPAALMLPWYVAGNLTDIECQEVEAHLRECPTCQQELKDIRQLRGVLKPHYAGLPGPSPQVFKKVMARIKTKPTSQPQEHSGIQAESWASKVESWFRALFIPQWVPALAVALIVGQATLVMWMAQTPSLERDERPGFPPGPVIERSVPMATPSIPTIHIRLAFRKGTSESEFRMIIQNLEGRIIDGPSQEGTYVVAVPGGHLGNIDKKLQALLADHGSVRIAERVSP